MGGRRDYLTADNRQGSRLLSRHDALSSHLMNDLMPTMAGTAFDDNASSSGAGLTVGPEPLSAPPDTPPTAAEEPSLESLRLSDGADAGVARYCDRFFTSPESARSGSKALLTAFADNGAWLSSLMQPSQLVAEVRQSCCALTSHVIMYWINQGETHKLARLADALLDASPPLATHEAGQIMALLASLLGILRPVRAQNLITAALPLLEDPLDSKLRTEAEEWVEIGNSLRDLPPDERVFWNRRLREPDEDWEWESTEACAALKTVAPLLRQKPPRIERFQELVPACWWELLLASRPLPTNEAAPSVPKTRRGLAPGSVFVGVLLGAAGAAAFGWWWLSTDRLPRAETAPQMQIAVRPSVEPANPAQESQPAKSANPTPPAPNSAPTSTTSAPPATSAPKPIDVSNSEAQPETPKPSPLTVLAETPPTPTATSVIKPATPAGRDAAEISPAVPSASKPEAPPASKPEVPKATIAAPSSAKPAASAITQTAPPPARSLMRVAPASPPSSASTPAAKPPLATVPATPSLPPTAVAAPAPAIPKPPEAQKVPAPPQVPTLVEARETPEPPDTKPPSPGSGASSKGSAIAAKAAPPPPPPSPADTWRSSKHPMVPRRIAAVEALAQKHPLLQRLHSLVKSGSYRENEMLVQGRNSVVSARDPEYKVFLRWILLDPPRDGDTSTLAAKLAIRTLPPEETFSVIELIAYPGSPNEAQGREIAGILLSLGAASLTQEQCTALESLAKANP